MNFYAVLGVPPDADEQAIRTAYHVLARRYHPDRGPGSSSEKFREITEAYETLIDPGSRRRYDLSQEAPQRPTPVRVEPTMAPSAYPYFTRNPRPYFTRDPFEELLAEWFASLDDWFFW
jgi:curved DNA-binding protein CbpA